MNTFEVHFTRHREAAHPALQIAMLGGYSPWDLAGDRDDMMRCRPSLKPQPVSPRPISVQYDPAWRLPRLHRTRSKMKAKSKLLGLLIVGLSGVSFYAARLAQEVDQSTADLKAAQK